MKFVALNWADYAIIAIVGLSILISLVRGFVREALSLVTWIAAFWVAFTFYGVLSDLLTPHFKSASIRTAVAFGGLFLATLLIGALINYLISLLVDKTGLSGTDRVLGVFFGAARGILLVTVLLMLARLTPLPHEPWWDGSYLIQQLNPIEKWLQGYLPPAMLGDLDKEGKDKPKGPK